MALKGLAFDANNFLQTQVPTAPTIALHSPLQIPDNKYLKISLKRFADKITYILQHNRATNKHLIFAPILMQTGKWGAANINFMTEGVEENRKIVIFDVRIYSSLPSGKVIAWATKFFAEEVLPLIPNTSLRLVTADPLDDNNADCKAATVDHIATQIVDTYTEMQKLAPHVDKSMYTEEKILGLIKEKLAQQNIVLDEDMMVIADDPAAPTITLHEAIPTFDTELQGDRIRFFAGEIARLFYTQPMPFAHRIYVPLLRGQDHWSALIVDLIISGVGEERRIDRFNIKIYDSLPTSQVMTFIQRFFNEEVLPIIALRFPNISLHSTTVSGPDWDKKDNGAITADYLANVMLDPKFSARYAEDDVIALRRMHAVTRQEGETATTKTAAPEPVPEHVHLERYQIGDALPFSKIVFLYYSGAIDRLTRKPDGYGELFLKILVEDPPGEFRQYEKAIVAGEFKNGVLPSTIDESESDTLNGQKTRQIIAAHYEKHVEHGSRRKWFQVHLN